MQAQDLPVILTVVTHSDHGLLPQDHLWSCKHQGPYAGLALRSPSDTAGTITIWPVCFHQINIVHRMNELCSSVINNVHVVSELLNSVRVHSCAT